MINSVQFLPIMIFIIFKVFSLSANESTCNFCCDGVLPCKVPRLFTAVSFDLCEGLFLCIETAQVQETVCEQLLRLICILYAVPTKFPFIYFQ